MLQKLLCKLWLIHNRLHQSLLAGQLNYNQVVGITKSHASYMSANCFYTFIFFLGCHSLKSVVIHVPEVAKSGDTVTLSCDYDLEQAALYTIKWYRNDVEFYRFVPKESPPSKAFSVPFINVDVSRRNLRKNVSIKSGRGGTTSFSPF